MKKEIDFKSIYIKWLHEKIDQYKVKDGTYRMTLPFLDRNNDYIEVYILQLDNDRYRITDDSTTINELDLSGVNIFSSTKRKDVFENLLNVNGVSCSSTHELYVDCTIDTLAQQKHMLTQCIMKVSDLFYLSRANVKSLFLEDVTSFLYDNNISYTPDVAFIGKSRLTSTYDFSIGKSKKAPTRIISVVNTLNVQKSKNIVFNWTDTQNARKDEMVLYTFIQDQDTSIQKEALNALVEYQIKPILWTKRATSLKELCA